jgi:2-polyprenyl-3-methyl-5-hydroxy-6-metoxy-1,4-benzoquinol methylase
MQREECVICSEKKFTDVFEIINTINYISNISDANNEIKNLNFIGCLNCGCVQLKNLFDPNEIYDQKSHFTSSNIWIKHNIEFSNFINNCDEIENIIEVGGGSGKLAQKIIEENNNVKYNILEITPIDKNDNKQINYLFGNCETFDFNSINIDTLIMSHVFEHLYEPKQFIKNIINTKINNIFISNPDMENLIKMGDINCLNIQHTYYIDTNYMCALFEEFGFNLIKKYNYENNSVFYHFQKNRELINFSIKKYKNLQLLDILKKFYFNLKEKINNIIINEQFYICPSGFYGIILYNYLPEITKSNIIGFLDSDTFKIGNRLSGTTCYIYDKLIIKDIKEDIKILLIADKYKDEIIYELKKYKNNIIFI